MIPNITWGKTPVGLVSYLVGEGRRNEHEFPHLLAGSPGLPQWYADRELSHEDAVAIGQEINQPFRVFGGEIPNGHIRHISLSLPKDDGKLPDGKWAAIATDFMRDMGYIDVEGKADVRWAALHHGLSGQNGNDHIHLVVNLVREDGTKASTWKDFPRAQKVCRELEKKHELFRVSGISSAKGYTPREVEAGKMRGRSEHERATLERAVRAASTASLSEDEFVRRLRGEGLLVKPSLTKDGDVRGYSVALVPPSGQRAIFYGGSTVARDLGLGVLRNQWDAKPADQVLADKEWTAAARNLRVVAPGREQADPDFSGGRLSEELKGWADKLAALDPEDHEGWRAAAGEMAGAFSAWSRATEDKPGPLAEVAKELSRSAQLSRQNYRPKKRDAGMGWRASSMLIYLSAQDDPRATLAVFRRMLEVTGALRQHHEATGDLVRVRGMDQRARARLVALNEQLHVRAGLLVPGAAQAAPAQPVMGAALQKTRTAVRDRAGVEKGM
jgi:hypothetical protein